MPIYDSAEIYINSAKTARETICRIDQIIKALLATALKAAVNENITEYDLDDGQTKIKTVYRGISSINKSIKDLRTLKEMYKADLNGRVFRLVDSKNINRFNGNGNGKI